MLAGNNQRLNLGFVKGGGRVIMIYMERPPWKQIEIWPELWPKKMSPEELKDELDKINDEFRRAGNRGERKGENLISNEKLTEALEEKGAKPAKILSRKENAKKIRELIEKLEQ